MDNAISDFLSAATFAVAGASNNQEKYGSKVFRALIESGRTTYPLNPNSTTVDGHPAFARVSDVPEVPESLSIVTPPLVTRAVVEDAIAAGVKYLWMQPGAEDAQASETARQAGLTVIDDGSCILVMLVRENR